MSEQNRRIPRATIRRIPLYYRAIEQLQRQGVQRVRSDRLSEIIHIPSATIRRDFSHFGELGKSGYGYSVSRLAAAFGALLEVESAEHIAIIGVGGLGRALIVNNFRRNPDLTIVVAFDIDPAKVGQSIAGVPVYAFTELAQRLPPGVHTAIMAVPSAAQAAVVPVLENAGITAIMTFAPLPVQCRPTTTIRYIDLTSELQSLLFTARQREAQVAKVD
ncbi:redox-sensing transcriptional repressor Rex [Lacticaseibacillus nasuensis]|uniref:redox-sensing transcriptional repressor Rex n=1 Tax=Lacticaseibacillus nasuensis TaxID=944671 RepID=UPI0022484C2D|nr:redox-sensing transcriptional repressor Rex [Lacticaseibacillus nasuensis]MCX2455359.1 redox-sensing transcriptional repressor Rex [Lacticaseibacillus nasuensis]